MNKFSFPFFMNDYSLAGKLSSILGRLVISFVLVSGISLFAVPSAARSWRIADYQDNINVKPDGSADVQERITVVFIGSFQGIHRRIPVEYPGPEDTNFTLFLKVTRVHDENNNLLNYEGHTSGDYRDIKIYVPNAEDTTRTVVIDYFVRNVTRFFPDHDEFYWNVTGNDWPVPIDHAAATVQFPANAAGSLRAQAFTGVYGSTQTDATSSVKDATVTFESNNPLPMRGGLTIDVYLPKGILQAPSKFSLVVWFVGSNPIVLLPLLTLIVMFALWWNKGRDPDPGRSVAAQYEPPAGFTPAEAGALLGDQVHPRDITSTLVDLAVRGFVKIEETDPKGLVFHHKDYVFHLLKDPRDWSGLAPHEIVMLSNVFVGQETETILSSLRNRFYVAIPTIRTDIMSSLRQKGMYLLDPDSANGYSIVAALLIVAPYIIVQVLGWKDVFTSIPLVVAAGALSAFIWWLFAREMTAKTMKGAQTRVAVLGFQEFMNRVDGERLKQMPPDTFEKYLPYAMALGVEHHWAAAFQGIVQNPPTWYAGPAGYPGGMFNPIFFSNSMSSMATDMHQVFVSAPRANSSGSGWSGGGFGGGGGFSGGGFGGGGGGAF